MKIVALLSAVLLLALAVACSGDEEAGTSTTSTASQSVITPKVTTPKPIASRTYTPPPRTPTPVGPPPGASAICNDGTYSYSQHRRGTCSHHGGVARWLKDLPP